MEATTIYVYLLEEGSDAWRPVLAHHLGDDTFRIIADQPYNSDDEHWEFPPGSVVRCHERCPSDGTRYLAAFELVQPSIATT